MKKVTKILVSLLVMTLSLIMTLGCISTSVFAEGDNHTVTFLMTDDVGKILIQGLDDKVHHNEFDTWFDGVNNRPNIRVKFTQTVANNGTATKPTNTPYYDYNITQPNNGAPKTFTADDSHAYTFDGWATGDGKLYDFSTPVTDDLTLHPLFSASGETFTISTEADLRKFAQEVALGRTYREKSTGVKQTVKLADDITLTSNWTPIAGFEGIFDGNSNSISGLVISSTVKYTGFFSSLNSHTVVKDLTFVAPSVISTNEYVGVLAGSASSNSSSTQPQVSNVNITGAISVSGQNNVGGLIGQVNSGVVITNCSVIGTGTIQATEGVAASNPSGRPVGGLIGNTIGAGTVSNCTVSGVTISGARKLGGLIGQVETNADDAVFSCTDASVDNVRIESIATTSFKKDLTMGGLVGEFAAIKGTNTFSGTVRNVTLTGPESIDEGKNYVMGLVSGGTSADIETAKTNMSSANMTFDVEASGTCSYPNNSVYSGINGTPVYVAQIGDNKYETLAAAIDVANAVEDESTTTIVMIDNEAIEYTGSALQIKSGKKVTLDLNGFNVTGSCYSDTTSALIENKGTLMIQDTSGNETPGKITTLCTYPDGKPVPTYASNTITNMGTLTVKSGCIDNQGIGYACYAIDNQTNGNLYTPVLKIEGGLITQTNSTYACYAVRMCCNSSTKLNSMEITGGTIQGKYGIWLQPYANSLALLKISGGTMISTAGGSYIGYSNSASRATISVEITGGTFTGTTNGLIIQKGSTPYQKLIVSGGNFSGFSSGVYGCLTGGYYGNIVADYVVDGYVCIANTGEVVDKETYPYTVVPVGSVKPGDTVYNAKVAYYWDQDSYASPNKYQISTLFSNATYLCPSEYIDLVEDGQMHSDAKLASTTPLAQNGGTLYMSFGGYTFNYGDYHIKIPAGVAIATDREEDGLFAALGDSKIVKTTISDTQALNGKTYTYLYSAVAKYVAQVGENKYETLEDALAAITGNSGTIKILTDYDMAEDPLNEGGYVALAPIGKEITLDLNGKTLSGAALDVYGTLTVTDNSSGTKGSITGGARHGIWVNEGGVLNVEDGTITNADATKAGFPVIANPGTVNVSGGTIQAGSNASGAMYVNNGSLTMTAGAVTTANANSMAVTIAGTTTAGISGGTITATGEKSYGIFGQDTSTISVSGVTVSITSTSWGIAMAGTSTLNFNNGAVTSSGIGISTNGNPGQNCTINIGGGTIDGNVGIYQPSGKLSITGGTITGATGVYFKSNSLNISAGAINGNGEHADYDYNGNGANPTGDALVIDSCNYPNGINDVAVTGGKFKSSGANTNAVACYTYENSTPVEGFITGGKYSSEPGASYVAKDYKAASIEETDYHFQVGYATVEATEVVTPTDYHAEYSVETIVRETESTTSTKLEKIENLNVIVEGTKTETISESAATTAVATLGNIQDVNKIVTEAVDAAGTKVQDGSTVNIVIQVAKSAPMIQEEDGKVTKVTYEVHPEAVITVTTGETTTSVGTVELRNNQLDGSFSFKLYSGLAKDKQVKVTHIHDDGTSEELGPFTVDEDGYIKVSGITSFSQFTLEEVTSEETGSAKFGYTIALEDSINIVYNVKNLTGDLDKFTVTYIDPDTGKEVTVKPDNTTLNTYTIAKCAAKEMGDVHTVVVEYNGKQINRTTDFSIKSYCDAVISGSYGADITNLCKATLDYGSYAQKTFDYKAGKPVNGGNDYFTNANIVVPAYAGSTKDKFGNISKVSLALVTTSQTKMVVYFKGVTPFTDTEGYTVKVGGQEYTPTVEDGKIKVLIEGIAAKELNEKKIVTISNGTDTCIFTASPVDYMGLAVSNDSQVETNRAFYNYYLKAAAYFAAH